MAKIISIANQKGGVGKSTTGVSLGYELARRRKEVLLIDLDPQGQCATLLGMDQEPGIFQLLVAEMKPEQVIRHTGRSKCCSYVVMPLFIYLECLLGMGG